MDVSSRDKGNDTPFDRFRALVKRVVAVPKPEIDKRDAEYRTGRIKKQISKKHRSQG